MALVGRGFSIEEVTSVAASLLGGLGKGRAYLAQSADIEVGGFEELRLAEGGSVLAKVLGIDTISQPNRARVERVDTGEVITVPIMEQENAPSSATTQKFGGGGKTLLDSRTTTIFQDYEDSFKFFQAGPEVADESCSPEKSCSPKKERRGSRVRAAPRDDAPQPEEGPAEEPAQETEASATEGEAVDDEESEEARDALSPMRRRPTTPAATTPSAVPPRSFSLDDDDDQMVYPMAPRSFSVDTALLSGLGEEGLQLQEGSDTQLSKGLDVFGDAVKRGPSAQRHQSARRQRRQSARFPTVDEAAEAAPAARSRPRRMTATPSKPSEGGGGGAWESFGLTNVLGAGDSFMSRVATAFGAGASGWDALKLLGGGEDSQGGGSPSAEFTRATRAECTLPVDISFNLPESLAEGQRSVCVRGPHGPICVQLREGAQPGESMQVRIGPKTSYRVKVPEGVAVGEVMAIQLPDGTQIQTTVPPGKQAGDEFDLSPPCVMVHVPKGLGPGDEVAFSAPDGREHTATVPQDLVLGQYFEVAIGA